MFTNSKAKQIRPFGTDRDNETRNGLMRFKGRLFTLLVPVLLIVIDPAIAGPLKRRSTSTSRSTITKRSNVSRLRRRE